MTNWWRTAWFVIFLLGMALRLFRLAWQPLWWDEGYSVYFATEPLPTMMSLTALDIHPPLYYTLLHLWFNLIGDTGPETARLLSIFIGMTTLPIVAWACRTLLPHQRWLALVATFLVAISPIHIYYSQEIRMYGLALLMALATSTFMWLIQERLEADEHPYGLITAYVVTASLALLTLYYTGLLLLAHQLWTLARNRQHMRRQVWFLVAALLILLIQLPWWLYALPKLFTYVADKVLADQDIALPIWSYLWRHWLAFFTGHLPAAHPVLELARQIAAASIAFILIIGTRVIKLAELRPQINWLLCLILLPALVGFVVNFYYPFFPDGGERLLLILLPYLYLLLTFVLGKLFVTRSHLVVTLTLPLIAAAIGGVIYFTMPRYVEHDYRPVIADIATRSRADDTVLALFPWQVGYWRAYTPRREDGTLLPPQPAPVDQTILRWDDNFASRLDTMLQQGTLWFPMPLSFGSTLPKEIEEYLQGHSRNLENRWFSPATRLTAWAQLEELPEQRTLDTMFQEQVILVSGGAAPSVIASANMPLAVDLCWQPPDKRNHLRATLRLLDSNGYTWAKRDLTPLAAYAGLDPINPCLEKIAFNVPVGLPPDTYQLVVGVGPEQSDELFTPNAASSPLVLVSQITVIAPTAAISSQRLPIENWLSTPTTEAGLRLLGYNGPAPNTELLAGDEVEIALFLQNTVSQLPAREIYISLLDHQGNGVAGYQNWPLANYPTSSWSSGALAQVPVRLDLPAALSAGSYSLVAGFVDPATQVKSIPATLSRVQIIRRPASFTAPTVQSLLAPPATFGTHATLVGYSVIQEGTQLQLDLTWQVLQPLLPPHHIFVHLYDATAQRIDQSDGEPMTTAGRAPTGSWLAGEYVTTHHALTAPANAQPPFSIQTGLYVPATSQRLPVTTNGATNGDSVSISLPRANQKSWLEMKKWTP